MTEILTISELADWLKLTPSQIYSMNRARSRARQANPIPILKLNGNIRFRRADIEAWLERLSKEQA